VNINTDKYYNNLLF